MEIPSELMKIFEAHGMEHGFSKGSRCSREERELKEAEEICASCPGLTRCPLRGIVPTLMDGTIRYSPCCVKLKAVETSRLQSRIRQAQLPEGLKRRTFKSFALQGASEDVRKAFYIAKQMLQEKQSTCFAGNAGVGKSHLAASMVIEAMDQGRTAIFVRVLDLMDRLRAAVSRKEGLEEILRPLEVCDLLVLDDLGAENPTVFALERVKSLLDARSGKQTVITTNYLSPKELQKALSKENKKEGRDFNKEISAQRIVSRIVGMCFWCTIRGDDYRVQQAVARQKKLKLG